MVDVTLRVESVVRGYHVYKEDWSPIIGERFWVEVEETNIHDRYAVAVVVNDRITGHIPWEFSKAVYYFIKNNGMVQGSVSFFHTWRLRHLLTSQVSTSVKSHHVEFTLTKLENIAEIRKLLCRIFEMNITIIIYFRN